MKQNNILKEVRKTLSKAKEVSKDKGICCAIRSGTKIVVKRIWGTFCCFYYEMFKSSRIFTFQGKTYRYFYHRYNMTWKYARSVEVPIIWEIVKSYRGKRILEVGNVLSHYFPVNHDILDKYEKADGVINQDVVDFRPPQNYDLIVSISTLEHVGWDENPKEPYAILGAIENLTSCLAAGGKMVVVLPLGYNFEMDMLFREGKIRFTKQHYLKRISEDNEWIEVAWEEAKDTKYNYPFPNANGLIVGIMDK
jgi:hypothetical protein